MRCSRALCVAKLEDSVLAGDALVFAPPGSAPIAISGSEAVLYFSVVRRFAWLQNGALTPFDLAVDGEVVALRAKSTGIDLAVRREDGIRIVSSEGATLDFLPAEATTALLLPDSVVYATPDQLVLRLSDGSEKRFEAAGIQDLFAMTDGWVEARSAMAIFALRTDAARERLYLLPKPSHIPERRR